MRHQRAQQHATHCERVVTPALNFGLIVLLAFGLAGCSMFKSSGAKGGGLTATKTGGPTPITSGQALAATGTAVTASGPAKAPANEDYRLGALDLLEIRVFKIEDLDRLVRVDQNGRITLPLIGPVQAAGKSSSQLEAEIERAYAQNYLQDPKVSVFIKEYASQRVAVSGAVTSPGIFVMSGPTTLLEAIALAKGVTDVASTGDVALIRTVDGKREGKYYDISSIVNGKKEDPRLHGGDLVFVQTSGFKTTMKDIMSSSPLLSVVRGGF